MIRLCVRCGGRLNGPLCTRCGTRDRHVPAPTANRRFRGAGVVLSATAVLTAAAIGVVIALVRPFGLFTDAAQTASATPPIRISTITVVPPAEVIPPPSSSPAPTPEGTGALADYVVQSCGTDASGTHLIATVWVHSATSKPIDVIGVMSFTDTRNGAWIGQGGFSAAALPAGADINAYVNTADANDPNARQPHPLNVPQGNVTCTVTDLHYR